MSPLSVLAGTFDPQNDKMLGAAVRPTDHGCEGKGLCGETGHIQGRKGSCR